MNKRHVSAFLIGTVITLFFANATMAQGVAPGRARTSPVSKTTLSGKITDAATGAPLQGASIYFPDIKVGGISSANGSYSFKNLPEGNFVLEISFLGYASMIQRIQLRGDQSKDFALQPSIVENEAVTITGVSRATLVRKSPVPVDIVRKQDLLKTSSTNLIDALSKTPGVSQISTGPAISKPTIRGLGYNRLVVINDGVRQEGQQWGDEHGIEIDEYSVMKAEVLKGPASIMYGSDALAGVINIISNMPAPEGTIKGNLFTNYQTNNGLTGFNGNLAGNVNGFNWNAYGTYKSAYDYKNKFDGRVFNSRFNEHNFGGYVGLNKGWGYTHILVSKFNQEVGLVEGTRDTLTGAFLKQINNGGIAEEVIAAPADFKSRHPYIPRQHIQHFKISTDNSFNVGRDRLTVILGYQRNQRMESGDILNPGENQLYFDLNTINYNLQYHFSEQKNWQTTIGVNGMKQQNLNKGLEALIPEYDLFDIGGFVYTKKTYDKLTLSGGFRFDNRSLSSKKLMDGNDVKFSAFTKNFSNLSGSAGASYDLSDDVTLKFNVARGFRAPSIPELASNGAHEGTNRYEYGEQNLKSETSLQLDAGIEANSPHVSFSASLFYTAMKNFIFYRKLSAVNGGDSLVNINGQDNFAFRFDQDNAKLYGAEANLDIHPHPLDWLHVENTFTYVRGMLTKMHDGSNNLPFIPAARLINEVRADISKKGKRVRNMYVSLELDNTFKQNHPFTGYNTETSSFGYSLLNAGFGGEVMSRNKSIFSIYLSANNLTDKGYQNHLSRLKYTDINMATGRTGVFNTGRNFSFKVNIPFNFDIRN